MKKLSVYYEGWGERWLLGTLADDGLHLLFEYSAEALRQGLELSPRHLALRAPAYGDFPTHQMRLPGLVADALPDGWGLLLMDRLFRKHGRNPAAVSPLDRLAFINGRAIGALNFEPSENVDLPAADVQLLELAQQARVIIADKDSEALRRLAVIGGSPHGARPKVLVHYDPATGFMSTVPFEGSEAWLVKFQAQDEHKEVCAIEVLYAELAGAFGLDMPTTRYFDLDRKLAGFGIQRFDVEDGMRVPVHTLAGLMHANFRLPSSVDYLTFLRATRFITRSQVEIDKAFERAVFNVVFNNRDDHPKNFSYRLGRDRSWRLAPGYDLTFNEGPGGEHQMDVCGEGRNITRDHLLKLARQGGVDADFAQVVMARALAVAQTFATRAKRRAIRPATVKTLCAALEANQQRLA
ncbi:MAG: type II toxin-antitoxin system HipA family toxin [Aquabacterium sp.]|nr:MAG: type II toxin-antitoxin system HipA family toxin [Aquabacterium sp.]